MESSIRGFFFWGIGRGGGNWTNVLIRFDILNAFIF